MSETGWQIFIDCPTELDIGWVRWSQDQSWSPGIRLFQNREQATTFKTPDQLREFFNQFNDEELHGLRELRIVREYLA